MTKAFSFERMDTKATWLGSDVSWIIQIMMGTFQNTLSHLVFVVVAATVSGIKPRASYM